jgi:hypothetical protein
MVEHGRNYSTSSEMIKRRYLDYWTFECREYYFWRFSTLKSSIVKVSLFNHLTAGWVVSSMFNHPFVENMINIGFTEGWNCFIEFKWFWRNSFGKDKSAN